MLTFASDFGSPYPAAVKGVVLSRTDARVVDVAHDLPRQSIRGAAFWLREVLPYFPPAVHLAVVDPDVGTERAAVVLRVGDHALVGPDNGALRPVARRLVTEQVGERDDPDAFVEAFEIDYVDPASTTFHGRDVFGPAAADVHEAGVHDVGSLDRVHPVETGNLVDHRLPTAAVTGDRAEGEVLVVDDFGNVITNVPGSFIEDAGVTAVTVDGERVPVERSFAAVEPGEPLATVGSHGYVECDVNQGRGDEAFGLSPGDRVVLGRERDD
jgi:hypothetical protein